MVRRAKNSFNTAVWKCCADNIHFVYLNYQLSGGGRVEDTSARTPELQARRALLVKLARLTPGTINIEAFRSQRNNG